MLEHVPALSSRVDPCDHVHPGSSPSADPVRAILTRRPDVRARQIVDVPLRLLRLGLRLGLVVGARYTAAEHGCSWSLAGTGPSCARACAIRIGGTPKPTPKVSLAGS